MNKEEQQQQQSEKNGRAAEQRREQILEASRTVLAEVGFEKITTRRIAEAAGVNIATLHYYFGSKENLLTETVRYALERNARRLRDAMTAAPTACTALEQAFDALWTLVQERAGVIRYDLVVRGLRDEAAQREASAIYSVYYRLIEDILERHAREGGTLAAGITPQAFVRYVVAASDGVILQHLVMQDDGRTQDALAVIRKHSLSLMLRRREDDGETTADCKPDDPARL